MPQAAQERDSVKEWIKDRKAVVEKNGTKKTKPNYKCESADGGRRRREERIGEKKGGRGI
jgi:hypothetical protein